MIENIGDRFQMATKYFRNKMFSGYLDWSNKPKTYKTYKGNKKYQLPFLEDIETLSFDEAIRKRRSIRRFSKKFLSLKELGYLLWASTGIQRIRNGYEFRNAPSAGALYPVETYLFVNRVDTLDKGLYHYNIGSHLLEELKIGDFSVLIKNACLGQSMLVSAAVVLIWSVVFTRSKWKYKQRAYRYIYLDCGHIAQNLALGAASLDLGSCQVGAFYDDELNDIIELDGENESVIYLSAIGVPI